MATHKQKVDRAARRAVRAVAGLRRGTVTLAATGDMGAGKTFILEKIEAAAWLLGFQVVEFTPDQNRLILQRMDGIPF